MEKDGAKPWERPWTTDEIREHSANWNLAGDSGLLNHLQQFSQNLLASTHATEVALDKLVEDLKTTATSVENATNNFLFLANTQFVENRVYDDDEKETPPEEKKDDLKPSKTKEEQEAEVFQNVKKALDMGLALLDSHFEAVEVPASDSEEEESSASVGRLVLKPKNPYISRPLPYLIGSREFMEDDKVGLGDISSDTEDSPDQNIVQSSESDDEMEHDEMIVTPKRPMALTSSDLENSEPESDRSEVASKQKKMRTAGAFGEDVEERDMFGQESPPEADEVSVVKGGVKSAFSDELSSKLGVAKSQNVSERENAKDNIFVPSSEPEDDGDGLFSKANHSFTDKQGLFDDLEDWQSTSDSLWKNDNISSSKPNASKAHQTKEVDASSVVSDDVGAHDQEDRVFTIPKPKSSVPTNISQKEKISSSTPQDVTLPKPKVDSLFGSIDEPEDLFSQNYKDTGSPALFGKDDIEDDDLFAVPSSSNSSQPGPSQNSSKKKKLPGAVPVFSGVNLFGDLSPIAQRGSTSENTEGNLFPSGSGLQFQEPSSGLGSSVDEFKKGGGSQSQERAVASNETSSILDSQKLFENVVTSTKIVDAVPRKSSLFNTEIDSDSLFDKPKSVDQRKLSGSKIPASTSSSLKSKAKKTVSLFDDSDSGDDELLFSSTSSTSSRSRRSQGSGDVLGSGIERRTLPKKDLFDDNLLFGTLNKDEPDVDIFGSQTESKSKSGSFAKDNAVSGNGVISDNLLGSKKVTSSIFDDIDEVDDIFAVPKVSFVETQKQMGDKTQADLGKLSLFSDNLGDTNDIFSNEVYENKKEEGIFPVSEILEVPSHCDNEVSSSSDKVQVGMSDSTSSLLPKDSSQLFGLENESTPESQEPATVKNMKPSISRKPNVPKKFAPSSVLSQNNLNLDSKVDENNISVSDTRTENVKKLSNVEANDHECDLSEDILVEKVSDDQTSVSSVIKPDPPRTLNIRKTTDIVFGSPSNEDDDLFDSTQTDKLVAVKESISNEKLGNETLSSNNFSKLLEGFNSSSANIASTGSVSREQSSNDSESIGKNIDPSEDVRGPQKTISSPIKLLIDPRTLLPGARPPSKMVSSEGTIGFDQPVETSTLHSAGKERVKIQVKRRPQTRKARQEALRASSIEYDNIDAALTSQVSNSKNDNVENSIISSSASSSSPVNNATPKVFEPDSAKNSPVAEKNSSLSDKDPKLNSEGQSSVSESNHLPIKTDAFRSVLSDCLSGNSNALSPLTDEEDLFAVPHELPFDESSNKEMPNDSKNLFGGAPVLSPMDDKPDSENFSQSSLKIEENKNIETDLEDAINSKHIFDGDALGSDISSSVVDKNSNKTPPSITNTEEVFVNSSDSKWLDCDLERSIKNRGLFDDDDCEDEVESDDDDNDDLFSSMKKQSKSRSKAKKSTSEGMHQTPLFSPEVSLENTSKENVERKKSFSEEFHESLTQEVSNVSSQPTTSKTVSRDDKMVNYESTSLLPEMANESSEQNDDLFAANEHSKEIKVGSSVKTLEKNISLEKTKSHVASLFGDDSIESDDLFGSSSVPKMSVMGPKLKNTKESLFDDGDDDDDIFTLSLNKAKGPKSDAQFSKDGDSLLSTEKDYDDLFSKKSSGSKNQGSKPSAAHKVQSFEDPLTLFNK